MLLDSRKKANTKMLNDISLFPNYCIDYGEKTWMELAKESSAKNPLDFKYDILCASPDEWHTMSQEAAEEGRDIGSIERRLSAVIFAFATEQAEDMVKNHIIAKRREAHETQQLAQVLQQRQAEANVRADSASNPELQDLLKNAVAPLIQRIHRLEASQATVFRKAPSNPPHSRNQSSNMSKSAAGPAGTMFSSNTHNKAKRTQDDAVMLEEEEVQIEEDEHAEESDEDWPAYDQRISRKQKKQRPNFPSQSSGQARMGNAGHPQQKFQSRGYDQTFPLKDKSSSSTTQNRQQQPPGGRGRGQHRSREDHDPQVSQQVQSDERSYQDQDSQQIPRKGIWSNTFRRARGRGRGNGRGRSQE